MDTDRWTQRLDTIADYGYNLMRDFFNRNSFLHCDNETLYHIITYNE
jgi:hypothetical protein